MLFIYSVFKKKAEIDLNQISELDVYKRQPLKIRIKNSIYRYKRKKVEKTIVANPHSLSETVQYAKDLSLIHI